MDKLRRMILDLVKVCFLAIITSEGVLGLKRILVVLLTETDLWITESYSSAIWMHINCDRLVGVLIFHQGLSTILAFSHLNLDKMQNSAKVESIMTD